MDVKSYVENKSDLTLNFKTIFEKNGYPKGFDNFCIQNYSDNIFTKKERVLNASKKELIFDLPFLGKKSMQLRTR